MNAISAPATTASAASGRPGKASTADAGPVAGAATAFATLVATLTGHTAAGAADGGAPAGPPETGAEEAPAVEVGAAGELAGAALVALLATATSATSAAPPSTEVSDTGGALPLALPVSGASTEADSAAAVPAPGLATPGAAPAPAPGAGIELAGASGAPLGTVPATPGDGTDPAGPVPGEPLAAPATDGAASAATHPGSPASGDDAPDPGTGQPGGGPAPAGTTPPGFAPPLPGAAPPVAALGGLDAVGAPTDTARPAPPALSDQLVSVMAPFRRAPDGTHQLSLQLRPEELGGLHVDVRVLGNQISLHLRADVPATTDLLRANLEQLRADLEAAGFDAGSLDVGGRDQRRPEHDASGAPTTGAAARDAAGPGTVPVPRPTLDLTTGLTAAGLDIRL